MHSVTLPIVNRALGINGICVAADGDPDTRKLTLVLTGLPLVGRISIDLGQAEWSQLVQVLSIQGMNAFGGGAQK